MEIDPYVHAALVLKGLGKDITKDTLSAVIKAAGGEVDEAKAKVLEDALKDINWEEALKTPTVAAAPAAAAPAETKEEKKEEKSEEDEKKKEEEAAAGLANLFG